MYFSRVYINLKKGDIAQYALAEISFQIQRGWEHRKQGLELQVINKQKATRSAFNATGVMFDGEAFSETEDSRQMIAKQGKQKKRIKKSEK